MVFFYFGRKNVKKSDSDIVLKLHYCLIVIILHFERLF